MKMWELASGVRTPLVYEEYTLVEKFLQEGDVALSDREKVVAQSLVNKDILVKDDDEFRLNYRVDVWRD